jgi:hypothetical protein
MGYYIDPKGETKEQWLERNGERVEPAWPPPDGHVLICLIDNRGSGVGNFSQDVLESSLYRDDSGGCVMTVHTIHPDTHEFGLADDCERCREHAIEPFVGLDDTNLINLIRRVEVGDPARSTTESIAMGKVRDALYLAKRVLALRSLADIGAQRLR